MLLVIYLFSYDSSKSTSLLNVLLDVPSCIVFVNWIRNLLQLQKHSSFLTLCVLICAFLKKQSNVNCSLSWRYYFSIIFWHLYQTHTYINSLNDREIITSHLIFELHYKTTFLWQKYLCKSCNTRNHLVT